MNTARVKELTGLTDDKLNYLIKKIDPLKRKKTQGEAREYSFRDLVFLKVAAIMRSDGIRLSEVNQAIKVLDQTDVAGQPGILIRGKDNMWMWLPNAIYNDRKGSVQGTRITRVSGFLYDVGFYASVIRDDNQLKLDLTEEMMVQH